MPGLWEGLDGCGVILHPQTLATVRALLYVAEVRSHQSVLEPNHCEVCAQAGAEFCEYLRGCDA